MLAGGFTGGYNARPVRGYPTTDANPLAGSGVSDNPPPPAPDSAGPPVDTGGSGTAGASGVRGSAASRGVSPVTSPPPNTPPVTTPPGSQGLVDPMISPAGKAPQQYNLGNFQPSNDPNTFTTNAYMKQLNGQGIMGSANISNNNAYQQYQTDLSNWQQNNSQRQGLGLPALPQPQAPTYSGYNQQGMDQYWNALTKNGTGFNSLVTPDQYGLANSVQNGVTNGANYTGVDPSVSSNPQTAFHQVSNWGGPTGTGGLPANTNATMQQVQQQSSNPFIGYQGSMANPSGGQQQNPYSPGGQMSLYNSWGMPGAGNPFQYMSGQSSTPGAALNSLATNSGGNTMQGWAQILNALGINMGGNNLGGGGGVTPWGGHGGSSPWAGYGGMGGQNAQQSLYGNGVIY